MTRIVIVSGFRIFPASTGGQVRTSSIARSLCRMGYEVFIYSLAGRRADYAARGWRSWRIDALEPGLSEETHLGAAYGIAQMLARRLDRPRFWQHGFLSRGLVPRRLKAACASADVIISDFSYCPPVPGPWSEKPWFLISHQLEHRLLQHLGAGQSRFAERMRRIECEAPRRYRDIFACAEEDRDFYRAHDPTGHLRVPIISCAVDSRAYVPAAGDRNRIRSQLGLDERDTLLVFSGSGFRPNLEALERLKSFAQRESEFLARERVHLLVLGSMEPAAYREGALIATGRVPEVVPYFAAADAGLNPVMSGTGANVKLFEYLAARLPVLSTAFGVRGSDLAPGRDYIPYSPEDPKPGILELLRGKTRAEWRAYAEEVWTRHRSTCDIDESVKVAIAAVRDFPAA